MLSINGSQMTDTCLVHHTHLAFAFCSCAYNTNTHVCRVNQNHTYTVYIRYFWQGHHQIYGHIQCIYTVLANLTHMHPTLRQKQGSFTKLSGRLFMHIQHKHTNTHPTLHQKQGSTHGGHAGEHGNGNTPFR